MSRRPRHRKRRDREPAGETPTPSHWDYPGKSWAEWLLEAVMLLIWGGLLTLNCVAHVGSVSSRTGLTAVGLLLGLWALVLIPYLVLRFRHRRGG